MPPKGWSANEYRARQEMIHDWRVLMNYIYEHPKVRRDLARSMRLYAPPPE